MSTIKNNINTYADLTAYNADLNKEYPNISYIQGTDEVKWYKYDPRHFLCTYNVTSTSSATKLLDATTNISEMYIDGVLQNSVVKSYTFSTTGEHTTLIISNNSSLSNNFTNIPTIKSVSIGSGITSIAGSTFSYCTNLASVTIPNSITNIGGNAFNKCSGLASITIPSSVTSIGYSAFAYCSALSSVTVLATTPPTLGDNYVFSANASGRKIYVPAASVNAYKSASKWSIYAADIEAIPTT